MKQGDKIKIGSLFAGIGGFELGIERGIPNTETIWQVEKEPYCRSILAKHWPDAKIYDDVRNITKENVEPVDILIGGFPCQSISVAGKQEGLANENKSGLWWEFHRIISELRPRIVVMENVPNIVRVGGRDVVGSLTEIGYDCEWTVISASQFGAPHLRKRWFCVAYPNDDRIQQPRKNEQSDTARKGKETFVHQKRGKRKENTGKTDIRNKRSNHSQNNATDTNGKRIEEQLFAKSISQTKQPSQGNFSHVTNTYRESTREQYAQRIDMEQERETQSRNVIRYRDMSDNKHHERGSYWQRYAPESPLCRVDDGISDRVARLKALGNAIVPQCSEYIGQCIYRSGLLDDFFE